MWTVGFYSVKWSRSPCKLASWNSSEHLDANQTPRPVTDLDDMHLPTHFGLSPQTSRSSNKNLFRFGISRTCITLMCWHCWHYKKVLIALWANSASYKMHKFTKISHQHWMYLLKSSLSLDKWTLYHNRNSTYPCKWHDAAHTHITRPVRSKI